MLKIKGIYDMGVPRTQGIVDTIKGDFGFIRRIDNPIQIYFRVDDLIDKSNGVVVVEGSEVDFFVIAENTRGVMSDRAIHLNLLPKGTVIFEAVLAEGVTGTVVLEPQRHPTEEPGILLLHNPIANPRNSSDKNNNTADDSNTIMKVELWPRCMKEFEVCKLGDQLKLDVHHYKPDDLIFARNIVFEKYRKLGRESGYICSLKEKFGFIKSLSRGIDIYFKLNEVSSISGKMLSENNIRLDMKVTFDLTLDNSHVRNSNSNSSSGGGGGGGGGGGSFKLLAIRVRQDVEAVAAASDSVVDSGGNKSNNKNQNGNINSHIFFLIFYFFKYVLYIHVI